MTIEEFRTMQELSQIVEEHSDVAEFVLTGEAAKRFVRRVYGRYDTFRGDIRGTRQGECGNIVWQKVDMR